MQWLRAKQSEDPAEFWKGVEARRGGPVTWSSFATLLGRPGGGRQELAGLLYVVSGTAYFEDFEKDSWLGKLVTGGKKFQKTELTFALGEVEQVKAVSRGAAAACVAGITPPDALREAPRLAQWFSPPVLQVSMRDGTALFLDLMERRAFIALVTAARS